MKFRYEFDIKKLKPAITHRDKIFLIGSCFTENIGDKLKKAKFSVLENPHGILFNPVSVTDALIDCIENRTYKEDELFYLNESWHSWSHHSRYSGLSTDEALQKINESITKAHRFLREARFLVITLGSAWTYVLTEAAAANSTGKVAANNHKAPAEWFRRKLMSADEVLQHLDPVIHRLFLFNPDIQILFTISPVRHLREGVVENNRSKAVLIQAVHQLVDKFEGLYYFPAYELVIDDLRDYRFYAEDLVHPNYFATQYVWEKLLQACMDETTKALLEEIHDISLACQHKPFNPTTGQHRKFLETYLTKTKKLQAQYPFLDLTTELAHFNSALES